MEPKPPREGVKMEKVRAAGAGAATLGIAVVDESLDAAEGGGERMPRERSASVETPEGARDHHRGPGVPEFTKIHGRLCPPEEVIVPVDRLTNRSQDCG